MTSKAKCLLCGSSQKKFADSWDRWWFLSTIVQSLSCVQLLWHHGLQHTSLSCPLLCPGFAQIQVHWVGDISSHFILWHPLLLMPLVFLSIRFFSSELAFHIRWPKYWSLSIVPSNKYSGLISFRIDWFGLHAPGLLTRGWSRVFSSTTVWKHQFFSA